MTQIAENSPHLAGLRIHDLRRTAASLAISSGASIKAVQHMLGHKSASITMGHYLHLYTEDLETLADRLDQVFRAAADSDLDQAWTGRWLDLTSEVSMACCNRKVSGSGGET